MVPIRTVHAFTHYRSLGGVSSLLRTHLARDPNHGLDSSAVIFFERTPEDAPDVRGLGLRWFNTVMQARRRFAAARFPEPAVMVYHNGFGVPLVADLDDARRRIGVLHSDWPGLAKQLPGVDGLMDGFLCVSGPLREAARRLCPGLPPDRIEFLPLPAGRGDLDLAKPPLEGRPVVIGYAGRIVFEQKRMDRLAALGQRLAKHGLPFRLEFLGDGPQEAWLRRKLAGDDRFVFHGRLSGETYWQTLRGWDVIVFTSDYEGTPIVLLEAMSVGVLPVFPRIHCGGDELVAQLSADLAYPAGDLDAATEALASLAALSDAQRRRLRERAGELLQPHLGDGYWRVFADFVKRILEAPRLSPARLRPRRNRLTDRAPIGVLARLYPQALWAGKPAATGSGHMRGSAKTA